mgnify:CR=1 FL=1
MSAQFFKDNASAIPVQTLAYIAGESDSMLQEVLSYLSEQSNFIGFGSDNERRKLMQRVNLQLLENRKLPLESQP